MRPLKHLSNDTFEHSFSPCFAFRTVTSRADLFPPQIVSNNLPTPLAEEDSHPEVWGVHLLSNEGSENDDSASRPAEVRCEAEAHRGDARAVVRTWLLGNEPENDLAPRKARTGEPLLPLRWQGRIRGRDRRIDGGGVTTGVPTSQYKQGARGRRFQPGCAAFQLRTRREDRTVH